LPFAYKSKIAYKTCLKSFAYTNAKKCLGFEKMLLWRYFRLLTVSYTLSIYA